MHKINQKLQDDMMDIRSQGDNRNKKCFRELETENSEL